MDKIRWGLAGSGWAAERFAKGLTYTKDGVLEAVISITSLNKAKDFAARHGIKRLMETMKNFWRIRILTLYMYQF